MHELYELKEKLMDELTEYAKHGKFSREDVETVKYIASAIDHICNICEGEGYSGRNSMDGPYRYSREGRSYARRRDSMGRYSGANGMIDQLEDLKHDAPNEQIKQQIQQLIRQIEQL